MQSPTARPTVPGRKGQGELRLTAALFCERILQEKDESLSAIRIADRITVDVVAQADIPNGVAIPIPTVLLLVFRKERGVEGRHHITVNGEDPKGLSVFTGQADVVIAEGEGKGANLILRFQFGAKVGGFYWFNVEADGQQMTRIPLEVVITRAGASALARDDSRGQR
jgi:hypothetical protein